jgi:uncharacterized protein
MAKGFAHMELRSHNVKQAQTFYAKLFGWKLTPAPGMEYTLFDTGTPLPSGGMMQAEKDGTPHWVPYVFVDDVAAAVKQAQALGAKVTMAPSEVPGFGTAAVLHDPAGSPIGLFKPKM